MVILWLLAYAVTCLAVFWWPMKWAIRYATRLDNADWRLNHPTRLRALATMDAWDRWAEQNEREEILVNEGKMTHQEWCDSMDRRKPKM